MPRGRATPLASVTVLALLTAGCGSPGPDHPSVAYQEAESVESLAVPPDLTKPQSPGALRMPGSEPGAGESAELLPQFDGVRFVRAGSSAWVEMGNAAPDEIWPRIQGFIRAQGLEVAHADPALGIVETEWAERQDGPSQGGLTGLFNSVFGIGGDPLHDRYQFALERMDGGGVRIVIAHSSAQEVARRARRGGAVSRSGSSRDFGWRRSGGDPAVRAEMTKRMLVYLGMAETRAEGVIADARGAAAMGPPAQYVESEWGRAWVIVPDPGARRVFARVEDALVDIDAEIADAAFDQRRYRFRWAPPGEGGARAEPRELTVYVRAEDGATRITAGDADGSERSGAVHKALLRELTGALGGDPEDVQWAAPESESSEPREPGRPRSIMSPRRR